MKLIKKLQRQKGATRASVIFFIAILAAGGWWLYKSGEWKRLEEIAITRFAPCQQPITYQIGNVDSRFGISKTDFQNAVSSAQAIWKKTINRHLFAPDPNGILLINLVYDYRQQAADTLAKMGIQIQDSQSSYNLLKTKYSALKTQYDRDKTNLDFMINEYNTRLAAYNARVQYWNNRGGAPKDQYEALQQEKADIDALAAQIRQSQTAFNQLVDDLNAVVNVLNRLAAELNLDVANYNTVGNSVGQEFEEGVYQTGPQGPEIDIYEFAGKQQLVRVLAHELGHALGLNHVNDPNAIMYKLNESKIQVPTAADIGELKQVCRIK